MGEEDSIFGRMTDLLLIDFFDRAALQRLTPDAEADITILYGCGAALADWKAPLVYVDLPKNELQFRMAARSGLQRRHDTPHGRPGVLQTLLFHRLADPRRLQGGADPPHRLGRRRAAHRRLHVHERRRPARRLAADVPQQFPRPAVVRTRRLGRHLPARPHPGPQPRGTEHGLVVRTDGPRERHHVQT